MADEESPQGSRGAGDAQPGEAAPDGHVSSGAPVRDESLVASESTGDAAAAAPRTRVIKRRPAPTAADSSDDADTDVPESEDEPSAGAAPDASSEPADAAPTRRGWLSRFTRAPGKPKKQHKKAPWWELPVLIAVAIAVAVVIKTFLVQPFYIPSESMEKTLHGCPGCSGDRVLVNKLIFDIRDPHPGDIVVFRAPSNWDEEPAPRAPSNPLIKSVRWFGQLVGFVPPDESDLIKRVIAVGGQSVQCCDSQGRVQVSDNGEHGPWRSLNEQYIFENSAWDSKSTPGHLATGGGDQRTFGPITIPKGRLWVMGDHRGDSADSRFHCLEEAPVDHICGTANTTVASNKVIGKGVVIAWPPSRWRTLGTPGTFKHVAGAALPALGAGLIVLPLFGLRRRRRRR